MLIIVLSGSVFFTIVWLVYSFRFIASSLTGMSFFDAGILNVLLYTLFVVLPIFVLWSVFGFINQYLYNRTHSKQLYKLFSQMKKNQEYSDLLARIMLETEQNIKNSFMLNRFDLLISDINELLSDLLVREKLITSDQVESLWAKVQYGGKWTFGKVLIENYNNQPNFQKKILSDALSDSLLSGIILEFCARYQTLSMLLEKHDRDKIFMNIVETGVLGKVFAIIAPVAGELRKTKEVIFSEEDKEELVSQLSLNRHNEEMVIVKDEEKTKPSIFSKIIPSKREVNEDTTIKKDAFSLALERSFGKDEDDGIKKEDPVFDYSDEESVVDNQNTSTTQRTLDELKKEWIDTDNSLSSTEENDLTYPFGGWTDVNNYKK